jgi:hypothetical protein
LSLIGGLALKVSYLAVALTVISSTAGAGSPPLKPELAGVAFLTGRWTGAHGQIADAGQTSTGSSVIEPVANGAALLRRDHTDLFDAAGKPAGGFDQIMMIYPEDGTLRADYLDGDHVIHYVSAVIAPGRSVTFSSATQPGEPVFRLVYALENPTRLTVSFSMAPPGGAEFHSIATGALTKAAGRRSP